MFLMVRKEEEKGRAISSMEIFMANFPGAHGRFLSAAS